MILTVHSEVLPLAGIAIRFAVVFILVWLIIHYRSKAKEFEQNLACLETPSIILTGNDDYSLTGLTYEGVRIPDIEIKSKALYIDGQFKRSIARNSRLYNRGIGLFVDGKYVG